MNLTDLKSKSINELLTIAKDMGMDNLARSRKQDVIFSILKRHAKSGEDIYGDGVLEILQDGFGFLRSAQGSYLAGPDDIYVSPSQIRRFNLRTGDSIAGKIRPPKDQERYFALLKVNEINLDKPENSKHKVLFENLTPLFPQERLPLEVGNGSTEDLTGRIIDLTAPIGKGQRGLIVAPPKAGKTLMLQHMAQSIIRNNPECQLIVLLIDERPEEVTEMERSVLAAEVVASTFDEPPARHVQVAEMVLSKAKRLVEHKKDVIILLDSITRLARAYNTTQPSSGKVLTGG
ncbi:MAG: transcription termination factor Rho, partial [Sinobacterium sp.]|nr:transcription termination factor Rho [Sinobacterium sp.]